jgi:hypothetical protein
VIDVRKELDGLAAMGKDWDGFGSDPPTPKAVGALRRILTDPETTPPSRVYPSGGTGAAAEWQSPEGKTVVQLEVDPDGRCSVWMISFDRAGTDSRREFVHIQLPVASVLGVKP